MTSLRSSVSLWILAVATAGCGSTVETTGGAGQGGTGGGTGGGDPCSCTEGEYAPVCGVDGTTYDSACGLECVPVDIACQGECPCTDCDAIQTEYASAVADAKSCDPALDVRQCTEMVAGDLTCQCPTYVDASQDAAIAQLDDLLAQWTAAGCGGPIACDCAGVTSATCEADGSGAGSCTDVF